MSALNFDIKQMLKLLPFSSIVRNNPYSLHDMQGQLLSSSGHLKDDGDRLFSRTIEYEGIQILILKGMNEQGKTSSVYFKLEQAIIQEMKMHDKINCLLAQTELEKSFFCDVVTILENSHHDKKNSQNIYQMMLSFLRTYIQVEACSIFVVTQKEDSSDKCLKMVAGFYNDNVINVKDAKQWDIDSNSILGITALNQQYYISKKVDKDANYRDVGGYEAPSDLACFPIVYNDSLLGVINLKNNLRQVYNKEDVSFIHRYIVLLAHVIHNIEQEKVFEQIKKVNTVLGKYVSHNVVEEIELKGIVQKRGEGVSKKAVCLFCDIRSFTSISEKLDPSTLVTLLNVYFSELIPIIEKYEGTVDKLVGDMIAAFWNLPQDVVDAELKAAKAAVEMQKVMIRKVVPVWMQAGVPRIGIGIGVYAGQVIAGNLGSSQLMNYTVMGDTVHNAELLESMARPGEVWISEEIRKITDGKILKHERVENGITFKGLKKTSSAYVLKPIDYPDY